MMLGGLPAPYGNAAPGASLDYVPSMSMPYAHGTELGGMHGMNPAAFFPHAANLPPTPHWSQPVRPRHEPPALTPAALGDGVQPTPGAPHMADARAGAGAGAADEYRLRITGDAQRIRGGFRQRGAAEKLEHLAGSFAHVGDPGRVRQDLLEGLGARV